VAAASEEISAAADLVAAAQAVAGKLQLFNLLIFFILDELIR